MRHSGEGAATSTDAVCRVTEEFFRAACNVDEDVLASCAQVVDIRAKNDRGMTPLHCAARNGGEGVVALLLDRGANFNAVDNSGMTALHHATEVGDENTVKLLIRRGAELEAKDAKGLTALHYAVLYEYAEELIEPLLDLGADLEAKDAKGLTPLHCAAGTGDEGVVALLLDRCANFNAVDNSGMTALHHATEVGDENTVKLLIRRGADLEAVDNSGMTALHYTVRLGDAEELIESLLDLGADLKAVDNSCMTVLHHAVGFEREDIVELLIRRGADFKVVNNAGNTPLHVAAEHGHDDIVKLLLAEGADLNAVGDKGNTSLHVAAKYGKENIVKLLLAKGADATARNNSFWTPLHLAIKNRHTAIVKIILDVAERTYNKKTLVSWFVLQAFSGEKALGTPLHIAIDSGCADIIRALLDFFKRAPCQGRRRRCFTVRNRAGETVLHRAALTGNVFATAELLTAGADVNVVNPVNYGETPLSSAVQAGKIEIVHLLLKWDANVNLARHELHKLHTTALHDAAYSGNSSLVKILLAVAGIKLTFSPENLRDYSPKIRELLRAAKGADNCWERRKALALIRRMRASGVAGLVANLHPPESGTFRKMRRGLLGAVGTAPLAASSSRENFHSPPTQLAAASASAAAGTARLFVDTRTSGDEKGADEAIKGECFQF